jgi:Cell morphogenesis N-terminal
MMTSPDANGYYSAPGHTPNVGSGGALHNSFGRDPSITRGRGPTLPSAPNLNVQKLDRDLTNRTLSPRAGPSGSAGGDGSTSSRPGTANGHYHERRRSITQGGHYRQGSSAQTPQMHSRDNSQAGSAGGYSSFRGQDQEYYGSMDGASDPRGGSSLGFYPSMASSATLVGSERSGSISEASTPAHAVSPPRMDNKGDSKQRREHGRSGSKANSDLRSVGEYALHHLFNSFVGKADFKINQCVASIPETVAKVEDICGPGVDKDFDSLISALGHIARQKPKHLVDTIMYWRKAKSEEFQAAQAHWNTARASNPYFRTMQRRNTETSTGPDTMNSPGGSDEATAQAIKAAEVNVHQTDRKLSLSIYLICRVLIEVYQQSDLQSITATLDDRLEDLIFDQLHRLDPGRVEASPYHYANWTIYGQLLGVMSTLNFPKVSRRFINVLKAAHDDLAPKGATAQEPEARLDLLVRAMNYVSIDAFPESRWIDSCDFMCNLARFFANSHGQMIKHAYCDVIERLVFPVAATPGPQVVNPRWKEFLNLMNNRIAPMLVKPKHWSDAFSLSTLLLCASPGEVFSSQWLSTITSLHTCLRTH